MTEPPYGVQSSQVPTRRIVAIAAGLAVFVVIGVIAVYLALTALMPRHAEVMARRAPIPPLPRLQSHPTSDLQALRAQKHALLSTWAWTDPSHRFARIPIQRAMQIYVRQHRHSGAGGTHP